MRCTRKSRCAFARLLAFPLLTSYLSTANLVESTYKLADSTEHDDVTYGLVYLLATLAIILLLLYSVPSLRKPNISSKSECLCSCPKRPFSSPKDAPHFSQVCLPVVCTVKLDWFRCIVETAIGGDSMEKQLLLALYSPTRARDDSNKRTSSSLSSNSLWIPEPMYSYTSRILSRLYSFQSLSSSSKISQAQFLTGRGSRRSYSNGKESLIEVILAKAQVHTDERNI